MLNQKRYLTLIFTGVISIIICCFIYREVILNEPDRQVLSAQDKELGMHLITNYPLMTETPWIEAQEDTNKSRLWERQLEIEEVLQRNLNNGLVTTVHLLVNQPSAEERLWKLSFHNNHKIVVRRIERLPKYKDFFAYSNEKLLHRLVVMLNMDIYIGEGFELLDKKTYGKRKYILCADTTWSPGTSM